MLCQEALILSGNVLKAQNVSEKVKAYLDDFSMVAIRKVYRLGIMENFNKDYPAVFEMFDKALSLCPELYDRAGAVSCGPNHLPFRYVAFYRKYGYGARWHLRKMVNNLLLWMAKEFCSSQWRRTEEAN